MIGHPTGRAYLAAVTELLQRQRIAYPDRGVWEAADLQWWWRKDQHKDPRNQVFWDEAAIVITDWGKRFGCDLLGRTHPREMLPRAVERLRELGSPVEMVVRDDDRDFARSVLDAGFRPSDEVGVTTTIRADEIPSREDLAQGFRLLSREETEDRPHHMTPRNGEEVAERLRECSIYSADLDLVILGGQEVVAGYALFWADAETEVGLVEPMRIEESFQGRGLGKALLAEGLKRLVRAGCSIMKVTYIEGNQAAKRLYLGGGFRPEFSSTTFTYNP